jgi:predicted acylesterase/phospholipase RssA
VIRVSAEFQASPRGEHDLEDCDLIMKGGITSGVVYPRAVLALRDRYRFRSIGGGSVGAVAAALTAAAEYGREKGGFEKLKNEQKKLREPGFLLQVFRPSETARPLMDSLLDLAEARDHATKEGKSVPVAVLRNLGPSLIRNRPETFVRAFLIGTVLGMCLFFAVAWALASSLSGLDLKLPMLAFGVLFGWFFGLLWVAVDLTLILLKRLPEENFFGMCNGHEERVPGRHPLLTDWLSELLNDLAGKSKDGDPLTFRELSEKAIPGKEAGKPAIDLRMLTTNLNQTQPYLFPRKPNTFVFDPKEMRKLFPENVVRYMEEHAALPDVPLPDGLRFLPEGEAMPVIVPVRMALSFPILLSAIPLRTIESSAWERYRRDPSYEFKRHDLLINWFSDGGICSNFPIHFFDAWLPRHPTFGINLTTLPDGPGEDGTGRETFTFCVSDAGESGAADTAAPVAELAEPWLPGAGEPNASEWARFKGLLGFGRAILGSAMNYHDNMQARLPSYRERVAQVRLAKGQGGLNLGMDTKTIKKMEDLGEQAGLQLRQFDFAHHRWVRLRLLMNLLEKNLEEAKKGIDSPGPGLENAYQLLQRQSQEPFPYSTDLTRSQPWIEDATRYLEGVAELGGSWSNEPDVFQPGAPRETQPQLRVTPDT